MRCPLPKMKPGLRNNIKVLAIMSIILLALPLSEAHFICGEVKDAPQMSAQWLKARTYYPEDRSEYVRCRISPEGNKYCCDIEELDKKWEVGYVVESEIFDQTEGYFGGPVSIKTTGEGYDVAPKMEIKKAIKIERPSKLIISNKSEFLFNATFKKPYTKVELLINNNNKKNMEGEKIVKKMRGKWGENRIEINSSHEDREFKESKKFFIIKDINLSSNKNCLSCRGNKIDSNKTIKFNISLNLSHNVEGVQIKEYIHKDWEVLSGGDEVKSYSKDYKVIVWNISGKTINKKYTLRAPLFRYRPRIYNFSTELGGNNIGWREIRVHGLLPFFPWRKKGRRKREERRKFFPPLSPDHPAVINPKNNSIEEIAVFPNESKEGVEFDLEENIEDREGWLESYLFNTNLDEEEIKKILMKLNINKSYWEDYKNISLYALQNGEWEKKETLSNREERFEYEESPRGISGFAIAGEGELNKNWINKIIQFFKGLWEGFWEMF